jgi:hypothetical protein
VSRGKTTKLRKLRRAGRREPQPVYVSPVPASKLAPLIRQNSLDRRVRPTARWLERWAAGQGSGLPMSESELVELAEQGMDMDEPRVARRSLATPLSDSDAVLTDLVLQRSPEWASRFVKLWYRTSTSVEQIAQELGLDVREVYREHKVVLAYYLGRLTEAGLPIAEWETDT